MNLVIRDGRIEAFQVLGFSMRRKQAPPLQSPDRNRGGWFPLIQEFNTGAWQRNEIPVHLDAMLAYFAVYACTRLIAQDISKMRVRLMSISPSGIWQETNNPAYSPVLRRPNHYQTRIRFFEWWVTSKFTTGNTYVLKQRDRRGVVTQMYILDPFRCRPLIADDGSVFYELRKDALSKQPDDVTLVPAREIMHDVCCPLFHPLVGVSPIFAAGMAALQGSNIQKNSIKFFANHSQPGGVLTAPGHIQQATADRVQATWESEFGGDNVGKVAVLGDGLKYEPLAVTAKDAELIAQLKFTAEIVCAAYLVPPYKIGIQAPPSYNNVEALNQEYYSQALQNPVESIEQLLDDGLGLDTSLLGISFDLDDLMRMDTQTKTKAASDGIGAGFMSPNEARAKFDLPPVTGGNTPYLQQQNFSLAALDRRDRMETPVPLGTPAPAPEADEPDDEPIDDEANDDDAPPDEARAFELALAGHMATLAKQYAPPVTRHET